jgi:hypothetical protein
MVRLLLALAALALVASGCGSKGASGSALDTALSYMPKGAAVVVAVDTDPNGAQWQQVDRLLGKFLGGGQLKQSFKSSFGARSGLDWDRDVRPLLGNDLVVAFTTPSQAGGGTPYVLAWKVKDEAALERLLQKRPSGATAVDHGVLVAARTKAEADAAVKRAGGGEHMTEQDFTDALGGLNKDSLLRVAGNLQGQTASRGASPAARKVKWMAALRTFGATLSAEPDGVAWALDVKTDAGALTERDLPLASGALSAPVVRRAGEVGFGLRDPAQIYTFAKAVAQVTDPAGYAKFTRQKAKASRQMGVDVDRDVIGQLTGNAALSVGLGGAFAMRADLRDPAAMEATLKKAAAGAKKLAKGKHVVVVAPKGGRGFYALTSATGKKFVFGVVGRSLVVATDAARAAQFAGQSPSTVRGAKGSFVVASDARSLANAAAAARGQGVAAQLVTGALGDLIGSVEAETSGITSSLKLFVR